MEFGSKKAGSYLLSFRPIYFPHFPMKRKHPREYGEVVLEFLLYNSL